MISAESLRRLDPPPPPLPPLAATQAVEGLARWFSEIIRKSPRRETSSSRLMACMVPWLSTKDIHLSYSWPQFSNVQSKLLHELTLQVVFTDGERLMQPRALTPVPANPSLDHKTFSNFSYEANNCPGGGC